MPEGDQDVMWRPEMKEMFLDDMLRAGRQQLHAPIYDVVLFARPWGFALRDIRVPIRFWHGDADHIVPLAHGEHQATLVPDSDLKIRPRDSRSGRAKDTWEASTPPKKSSTRSWACGRERRRVRRRAELARNGAASTPPPARDRERAT
jgi:hypothetical protein